ncbi:MAG: UDP-N-acetylglucosamine 1-carboxyvinyltransferase, partial [Planctomycetes bacterium]|nr:UDP-N-acetylglucosamine 1-carboxyvinyltransferase [Planctomycetota bacterium]
MARFRIQGGVSLSGSVDVAGSKNAALPIMAASILADAPVELLGVPQVADVATLSRLLGRLGVCVRNISPGSMHLETVDPLPVRA